MDAMAWDCAFNMLRVMCKVAQDITEQNDVSVFKASSFKSVTSDTNFSVAGIGEFIGCAYGICIL